MLAKVSFFFMLSWRLCSAPCCLQAEIQAKEGPPAWSFAGCCGRDQEEQAIHWPLRDFAQRGALFTSIRISLANASL